MPPTTFPFPGRSLQVEVFQGAAPPRPDEDWGHRKKWRVEIWEPPNRDRFLYADFEEHSPARVRVKMIAYAPDDGHSHDLRGIGLPDALYLAVVRAALLDPATISLESGSKDPHDDGSESISPGAVRLWKRLCTRGARLDQDTKRYVLT